MPRRRKDENLKTRPDLSDREWLDWLATQPENRGIRIHDLHRRMIRWCIERGEQPTRRRLLNWLDRTRQDVPITDAVTPPRQQFAADPEPQLPDCKICKNERCIRILVRPDSPYEWARYETHICTCVEEGRGG